MEKNIESTRQLKVAKEIQKHMAEIIRSKGMAAFGGALVSVSGVKISRTSLLLRSMSASSHLTRLPA
jgi:ribosome-binding factor A